MLEEWRDIKDYEGLYQISNKGNVRSLYFGKQKILKQAIKVGGYKQVCLYKNKLTKSYQVHRLVGESFIDNPNNSPMINHKDEDGSNNNVENLEWCNNKYNLNYGSRNKRLSKSLSKPIIGINIINGNIICADSALELDQYGFDHSLISKCCNGIRQSHKGYIWRFE